MIDYETIIEMLNGYLKANKEELDHCKNTNDDASRHFFAGAVCAIINCIDLIDIMEKINNK